jgi:hypothetical protein
MGVANCDAWHRSGRRRDALPMGDRIEIVLSSAGSSDSDRLIQIAVLIIFIRVVLSSIATGWRTGGPRRLKLRNDFHLFLYSLRRPSQIGPYQQSEGL